MGYTTRLRVTLSPFFRRYPAKAADMAERVNRRIAVNRERNYIYFRIPKAANSTVVRNLLEAPDNQNFDSGKAKNSFLRPNQLSWREVCNLQQRFFLFTVVRDPYARALSAYLDKVQHSVRRAKVAAGLNRSENQEINFEDFCHYLENGGLNEDAHWCRQVDLIPCGVELLNFVGRVENLERDLSEILKHTLGHHRTEIASHYPHRTNAGARMKEVYTRATVRRIHRIYAADFETFQYPREPDWLAQLR